MPQECCGGLRSSAKTSRVPWNCSGSLQNFTEASKAVLRRPEIPDAFVPSIRFAWLCRVQAGDR
eukprot:12575203-Alexandrium_andersonii.AAC.1